jgi:hypothetical protein
MDAQDPLPESGFLYRRITVWVVGLIILGLLWFNVHALRELEHGDGLVEISKWLIVLLALVLTYYLIAPSAEHIVRIFQTVSAWKAGIATSVTTATRSAAGATTSSKTVTGLTQQPGDGELAESEKIK